MDFHEWSRRQREFEELWDVRRALFEALGHYVHVKVDGEDLIVTVTPGNRCYSKAFKVREIAVMGLEQVVRWGRAVAREGVDADRYDREAAQGLGYCGP